MIENQALQTVCTHTLTLTELAHRNPDVQLTPCELVDYQTAIHTMGQEALEIDQLFRVLGINNFSDTQVLTVGQKSRLQELLGSNWANNDTAVVAILPCDMNGVPFTSQQISNGEHIAILRVNPTTHKTISGEGLPALIPEPLWSAGLFKVEITSEPSNINFATLESVEKFLQQVINHYQKVSHLLK